MLRGIRIKFKSKFLKTNFEVCDCKLAEFLEKFRKGCFNMTNEEWKFIQDFAKSHYARWIQIYQNARSVKHMISFDESDAWCRSMQILETFSPLGDPRAVECIANEMVTWIEKELELEGYIDDVIDDVMKYLPSVIRGYVKDPERTLINFN